MSDAGTADIDAKFQELLALSPVARLELGERLIESVPPFGDPEVERAWSEEIERRGRELDEGTVVGIPAREVLQKPQAIIDRLEDE